MNMNIPVPTGSPISATDADGGKVYYYPAGPAWLLCLGFGGQYGPDQGHDGTISLVDPTRAQFMYLDDSANGAQMSLSDADQVTPPDAGQPTVLDASYQAKTIYEQ